MLHVHMYSNSIYTYIYISNNKYLERVLVPNKSAAQTLDTYVITLIFDFTITFMSSNKYPERGPERSTAQTLDPIFWENMTEAIRSKEGEIGACVQTRMSCHEN